MVEIQPYQVVGNLFWKMCTNMLLNDFQVCNLRLNLILISRKKYKKLACTMFFSALLRVTNVYKMD